WGDRVWIIDPLDGTTNFTHGHPFFAVSVALSEGKSLLAGVVHAPALGETYWARAGGGAFLNGDPIRVAAPTRLQESLLATGFSYGRKEVGAGALERFGELLLGAREIRRGGSASLDLAYTASGTFSGFWEYHLKPHDVAAGALLVEEAGGIVTDVAGGRDFLLGGSIAAGNRAIHARLLETLKKGPRHPGAAARVSPGAGGARPATAPRAGR
ncbi:MAG: inositol monophosphatase family protein, partial [Planctomycetota bacterium]